MALFMFRFISIRKITFLGALVFLGFAIASIFIDPNEDGIDGIPDIQVATKYETNMKFDNLIQFDKNLIILSNILVEDIFCLIIPC